MKLSRFKNEALLSFDTVFDDVFNQMFPEYSKTFGVAPFKNGSFPKVNVLDKNDSIVIEADVAGWAKDDIQITVSDKVLKISGESKANQKEDEGSYLVREIKRSKFVRSFVLENTLDENSLDARYKDGLLTITIKKVQPNKPEVKNIQIN